MDKLNKQEVELLRELQKNSRFDINQLTEKLNMSRTSIYDRIKKLESEGYITNYVALIDPKKVGLNFIVMVNISLHTQHIDYVEEFLVRIRALDEVVEAFVTSGTYDVILKVIVQDPERYNDFITHKLSAIPHIRKIQSSFVMRIIKQSNELSF
ncbi:Lrp/AsnC family transcriptional regulator [Sphingobacterium nematocida]|uniref:Lrp/AsnC family transcriptional regulator n=1 Tax=Sphingobacterium nematocida TaxID=1513896 RepID=A0A1T5GN18_9SPHI|nr:Lrp/AsnC family transcriptional regulator [Sphingobacterium nematocida]SKC09787.1 Lrp/AsnC family transcriptional regulator [Sphingobacterium nematocida]